MKLYATITSDRAIKAQGGNKTLRIEVNYGSRDNSKQALLILATVLSPEANKNNQESVVFQIWGQKGELCDRLVFPLKTNLQQLSGNDFFNIGAQEAERRKAKKQKGDKSYNLHKTCMYDHDHSAGNCEYHD